MFASLVLPVLLASSSPAPSVSSSSSASAQWCGHALSLAFPAEALPASSGASDAEVVAVRDFDALAAAMPRTAAPVVARARDLVGTEGLERAMAVLRFAVLDACARASAGNAPSAETAQGLSAQAAALMANDPRFTGVRKGDGTLDRIWHKVWLFILSLVESEGMQRYAGTARTVFIGVIGFAAMLLVVVTVRRRLAEAAEASSGSAGAAARIEATRREAFASLRAQADALLTQGQVRASMRMADAALLARVGELDAASSSRQKKPIVTPARTHREIVAGLPPPVGDVVRAPFHTFDTLFFGRSSIDVADARAFLAAVDAAESRLARATTPAAQPVWPPSASGSSP